MDDKEIIPDEETSNRVEWTINPAEKIVPPEAIALLEHIKNYLYQNYTPAASAVEATIMMTTKEIYEAIYRLYPSDKYDVELISNWLHDGGFRFTDMGNLRFEWMLTNAK